ncbi:hypothetical protein WA026_013147 [Henosepilachna vigintioctopunctata]|uniref:AAA+ ATPase domain-containing protein n=1 Tax=Henosepilachna vigintioctopunctata TaxID=420089 RepID=A0AAW1UL87_9CUCU
MPMPYLSDPKLIPRLQKYLESNVDKTNVDISLMADELQKTYKEYSRRKRSAFRNSVKKAYCVVLESYGVGDEHNGSASESLKKSEIENSKGDYFNNSMMNNQLIDLYSRQSSNKVDEKELIDISMDDSGEESPNLKTSSGPSTSIKNGTFDVTIQENAKVNADKIKDKVAVVQRKKRKCDSSEMFMSSPKKKKSLVTVQEPSVTFKDVLGIEETLIEIAMITLHLTLPEIHDHIGLRPPRGLLLHGPPGCGKTLLANAIAGELGVAFLNVNALELVSGGSSIVALRAIYRRNRLYHAEQRERTKRHAKRILSQLLICLDELNKNWKANRVFLIGATNLLDSIDPALRREGRFDEEIMLRFPDEETRVAILKSITSDLKLAPDFDWRYVGTVTSGYVGSDLMILMRKAAKIGVKRFFSIHNKERKKADANNGKPEIIVDDEPRGAEDKEKGDTNQSESPVLLIEDDNSKQEADIVEEPTEVSNATTSKRTTTRETRRTTWCQNLSRNRSNPTLHLMPEFSLVITTEDVAEAAKHVQPTAKRKGFVTVPNVTFADIGALTNIREELTSKFLDPIRYKSFAKLYDKTVPTGILLFGPPGCGKTLLAKAIANEAGLNFISVKGPELLKMFVGESERGVRTCFERARNVAPSIIFFDEMESICPKRSDARENGATTRVVSQMLTEMDGMEERSQVYILAASNRPQDIDPAILRPGRLDQILFVGLPSPEERVDILKKITKNGTKIPLSPEVNLEEIGRSDKLTGYTGADLRSLVQVAAEMAMREAKKSVNFDPYGCKVAPVLVSNWHFQKAISKIRPSVPEENLKHYEKLRRMYSKVEHK